MQKLANITQKFQFGAFLGENKQDTGKFGLDFCVATISWTESCPSLLSVVPMLDLPNTHNTHSVTSLPSLEFAPADLRLCRTELQETLDLCEESEDNSWTQYVESGSGLSPPWGLRPLPRDRNAPCRQEHTPLCADRKPEPPLETRWGVYG